MRPCVAFSAATPVKAAGPRTEIMTSLPMPIGDMPAASAAEFAARRTAGRALEVPRIVGSAGDAVVALGPERKFRQIGFHERNPAGGLEARDRRRIFVGNVAREELRAALGENARVSRASLIEKGTPCRAPSGAPLATALSAASALASASSAISVTTALTFGLTAAMRSRCAWTTSREESCFVRMSAASAVASR